MTSIQFCLKFEREQKVRSSQGSRGAGGGVPVSEAGCQAVSQDFSGQSSRAAHTFLEKFKVSQRRLFFQPMSSFQ